VAATPFSGLHLLFTAFCMRRLACFRDGTRLAIEIRNWYGSIWLATLEPAATLHADVRSSLTEEEYLQQRHTNSAGKKIF
jgi:hypothetical protein